MRRTTMKAREKQTARSTPTEIQDILREAMQQPGVQEVMEVYGEWRSLDEATRLHRRAMAVKRIVSLSDHT
jgi:16S rRNA U1498 N3-methylase RsmE